jgi:hypothetical protein
LAQPDKADTYYYFHVDLDDVYLDSTGTDSFFPLAPLRLFYTVVRYPPGATNGIIMQKRQIAVSDTLARGGIQAVRHANGRDWWILMGKSHSNCYYRVLLTPKGLENRGLTCAGAVWSDFDAEGQCSFSQKGDLYLRHGPVDGLHIFPFDRCTGELSEPKVLNVKDEFTSRGGVCTSPSDRFVYATTNRRVWQFDLQAPDVSGSRVLVAEADGWTDEANIPDRFWLAQLAPDGRIYMASVENFRYLHVIHAPDSAGLACRAEKHAIPLFSYNFIGMPVFPNFHLDALKGSPCDTLILSSALSPVTQSGLFFNVAPNPAQDVVTIRATGIEGSSVHWKLMDTQGRLWRTGTLQGAVLDLSLEDLPPGVYYWQAQSEYGGRSMVKWIKVKDQ